MSDYECRKAALEASISWLSNKQTVSSYVLELASEFEDYLRNGRTR